MVEETYRIKGMTCASCAMKIEKALQKMGGVSRAHVAFGKRRLSLESETAIDREKLERELSKLGSYTLHNDEEEEEPAIYSILVWGLLGTLFISIIFYLVQALGMQDWGAPIEFMVDQWYLVTPLILGFGIQTGLFRAIHLLAEHGGGRVMAGSGSVSGGTMLACCMHNLVPLFPILGVSGLASFFAAYQTQVFLFSILVTLMGVGYMAWKYHSIKQACKTHHS